MRQFSNLVNCRERECREIIAQSGDAKTREKRRNELQSYLFYRGKVSVPPSSAGINK